MLTEPPVTCGLVGRDVEVCPCATPCVGTVSTENTSKKKTASLIFREIIREFCE